jgi:hypothetical protein
MVDEEEGESKARKQASTMTKHGASRKHIRASGTPEL